MVGELFNHIPPKVKGLGGQDRKPERQKDKKHSCIKVSPKTAKSP